MSMTNEELLLAMSEMFDKKMAANLKPIENRLDRMDSRLERIEAKALESDGNQTLPDIKKDILRRRERMCHEIGL